MNLVRHLSLLAALLFVSASASANSQIVARLAPNANPSALAARYGVTLTDVTANAPFALYTAKSEAAVRNVLVKMGADPAIVWVEGDESVSCPEGQARAAVQKGGGLPAVGDRTKLQQINKNLLTQVGWSSALATSSGNTIRLAILDTGLSQKQTALWTKVDASANFIENGKPAYDAPYKKDSNGNGIVDQGLGHGTMIAGIVDQIAPQVRLVVARIADSDGMATGWTLIKGLAFAVNAKAQVANVSLGSPEEVEALTDVMDWCEEKKLLVVAAAGNEAVKRSDYPARISKIVCVAGLDTTNHKADFSNWDSACDMAAPAVGFASQFWDGELAIWSGTSFAAPVVAAGIADCLRRTSSTTPNNIRKACQSSGVKIDNLNPKYKGQLGYLLDIGRLNQAMQKP